MIVSAPGKLILAGEYAVLDGGTAVVAAVNRRAIARRASPREPSAFIDAAIRLATPDIAAALREIAVDSSALRDAGGIKLGLGSSAAATVAAIGAAFAVTGAALDRAAIHELAAAAHAEAQGGKGSGADVAAAAYGGTLAFARGVATSIALPAMTWIPVWLGRAADTRILVAAVHAARDASVDAAIDACAAAGASLAAAATPAAVIAAITAGADAIEQLAAATGVDLAPAEARAARALARRAGGDLKTTGAGGGDVAIAALPPGADRSDLVEHLRAAGLTPLDLPFDPRGVDFDAPAA